MFLQVARHIIDLAKDIGGSKKSLSVTYRTRNLAKRIDWSDVDMDEDQYAMSIEASSLLSRTPAARVQEVIELLQSGLVKQEVALRLLGHPDLEREISIETAAIEDIEATIEELLDGEYRSPEPFQNLPLGITRVQMAYLKARREGAPEDVLEGMRQWVEQAQALLAPPAPPPDAMASDPGAMPPDAAGPIPPEMGAPAMPGTPPPPPPGALAGVAAQLPPS